MQRFLVVLFTPILLACTPASTGGSSSSSSGSVEPPDAAVPDAGPARCDGGPCQSTSLAAVYGAGSVTLDVAYLGLETTDAGTLFYVEAYRGAAAGCPQMNSPTPQQTLILSNLPVTPVGTVLTYADGVRASLLDFQGDLFNSVAPARAASLQVTVRDRETQPASGAFLVVELVASFVDGGTLSGTLAATHCDSLDY